MKELPKILPPPPQKPRHLSDQIKWLSGEGAGSWFLIEKTKTNLIYEITRFSPEGKTECKGTFKSDNQIDLNEEFVIDYPSHCARVTLFQFEKKIVLKGSS